MEDDKKEDGTSESTVGKVRKVIAAVSTVKMVFVVFVIALPFLMLAALFMGAIGANNEDVDSGGNGDLSYNPSQLRCSENGFSICYTSFSKEEFKEKVSAYAEKNPGMKDFAEYSDDYYDYANSVQVNPELVVTVALKENGGNITVGNHNYWGYGCTNTGGGKDCNSFSSFMDGAKKVIDSASNWDSLFNWFAIGKYSYIGDYWENPGGSGTGGCYYASYIYPNNMPDRVKKACATGKNCSGSSCAVTTQDDQDAYSNYLVDVMAYFRKEVFGLAKDEGGVVPNIDPNIDDVDVATIIKWDQETAWKYLIGRATLDRHPNITESEMNSRVIDIEVPMRKWKSGTGNNTRTDTERVMQKITVNKAIANVWKAFFEDVYENAPDFVIGSYDGCYEYRPITNGTVLSPHSYGVACDINASVTGNGYDDRSMSSTEWEKLPETRAKYQVIYKGYPVVQIAHKYTLINGSDWNNGGHDAMYFSFISDWTRDKSISCQGKSYCS